uniref:Dynein heavy chain hydrolytic ATP-binding dynein motor region domain-containing protein n=1 Tax=Xiphophorus maculatus TaxID=8083 RepID=A0A3B5R9M2_XIPMA
IRAVKAVISVAGHLRRDNPDINEILTVLNISMSLVRVSIGKNSKDRPVFLERVCNSTVVISGYINKCIQLYQTTVVRHGLMLVGPPASGKTKCYEVLAAALTALEGKPSSRGGVYQAVQIHVLNPKSITMPQFYGNYKTHNQHWKDGILPAILREGAAAADKKKRWYVLDGPLEAGWMDGLNTVLDDNKKLCLSCGEVINLTDVRSFFFSTFFKCGVSPTLTWQEHLRLLQ